LGSSGGIDSALINALAVEALGSENVLSVLLPSQYSSPGSITDAVELAKNLGNEYKVFSIQPTVDAVEHTLFEEFKGCSNIV